MEGRQVLSVIEKYNEALDLLDAYDHRTLSRPKGNEAIHVLTYEECMEAIRKMRFGDESDLFGREKDDSFAGSIGNIYQTYGGRDVYESLEEKAANLLNFVTMDHSFYDGNNRIEDSTLVALTIMIAESREEEKEMMMSVVMNYM